MRLRFMPGRETDKAVSVEVYRRLIADDRGVTAIEYTLIAALIAIVAVLVIAQIGTDVSAPFNTIASRL
jgi:pilus assembly protein Flp/PilA